MVIDLRVLGAVLFALACFGWAYNRWIEQLEAKGHDRGYLSFLVVLGVLVTGVGYGLVVGSLAHMVVLVVCFGCSGMPMIIGSVQRAVRQRELEEQDVVGQVEASFDGR